MTERLVVPTKPGNAGGGKGPQLKTNARSDEGRGIGDEPSNSSKCSEVANGVARKKRRNRPAFVSTRYMTRCT
jgi:hypothetical protein